MSGLNVFEAVMLSSTELMEFCTHIQRKISPEIFGIFQRKEGERNGKMKRKCRKKNGKERVLENSNENLPRTILERFPMKHFRIMRQISIWICPFQI